MSNNRKSHVRVFPETKQKINELKIDMISIERKQISDREVLRRAFNIPNLRETLKIDSLAKKKLNIKGLSGSLIGVFIMLGVVFFIMILFYLFGLIGPQISDALSSTTEIFQDLAANDTSTPGLNKSVELTFDNAIGPSIQNLQWFSYTLLIFLMLGFFFLAFWIRAYPFLIIFWIGGIVVLIMASLFMSSAYNDMRDDPSFPVYKQWKTNDFILSNLPHIFTAIGFVGGFILFILASRESTAEVTPF